MRYSIVMTNEQYLERKCEELKSRVSNLESELNRVNARYENMRSVLYVTFVFSALAIIMIIENLLYPYLRTL